MPFPFLAAGLGASALGSVLGAFGSKKAKMPEYIPPDLEQVTKDTAKTNLEQIGNVKAAESAVNMFRTEELKKMLEAVAPGVGKLAEDATKAIQTMVSGELTFGEEQILGQKAAAWGVGAGLSGSGMALNRRLFGYSEAMQQRIFQGLSAANQWISTARQAMTPGMADFSGMFMTPVAQARQEAIQMSQLKYGANAAQAQANAQPNPFLQAAGGFLSSAGGIAAGYGFQNMANDRMLQNVANMYNSGMVSSGITPGVNTEGMTIVPVGTTGSLFRKG